MVNSGGGSGGGEASGGDNGSAATGLCPSPHVPSSRANPHHHHDHHHDLAGHLTHGYYTYSKVEGTRKAVSATSIYFESLPYTVDAVSGGHGRCRAPARCALDGIGSSGGSARRWFCAHPSRLSASFRHLRATLHLLPPARCRPLA